MFRQSAEYGELFKRLSLFPAKVLKIRIPLKTSPDFFQRVHLKPKNFVPINQPLLIERTTGAGEIGERAMSLICAGNISNPQIKWIPKTSAARKIRACLLRQNRRRRAQGIGKNEVAMQFPRGPPRKISEISKIAHPQLAFDLKAYNWIAQPQAWSDVGK